MEEKFSTSSLFSFLVIFVFFSGIFLFLSLGLLYLLYDYALNPLIATAQNLDISQQSLDTIDLIDSAYLANTSFIDIYFGITLVTLFISSVLTSLRSKQESIISFFSMLTIGNLFLVLLLSYAVQVRGWFLNNIVYNVLTVDINMPILTFFYSYTYYIIVIWFLVVLAINQLDFSLIQDKTQQLLKRDNSQSDSEDLGIDFGGLQK